MEMKSRSSFRCLVADLLTGSPLDVATVLSSVGDPEHGGAAIFLGTTRREAGQREVIAIEYEAHDAMANAEIARILDEARARFDARVAAVHRVGRVAVGEPSVVVAASTGHRPEAFAACRFLIDEIKARPPIWKRIHYADGTTEWIDGTAHTRHGQSAAAG